MRNCPKCNCEVENDATECNKCGIIFSKYQKFQAKQKTDQSKLLTECKVRGGQISKSAGVRTSAEAVWSLILGILSLLYFGIFAGIPAIIGGHTARSKIRQSRGALVGKWLALSGLISGYISIGLTAFVILYTTHVAIPLYDKHKYYAKGAFNAAISELNDLESLTWADQKISVDGWGSDAAILLNLDYSLDGDDYRWTNGTPSAGGRVLSWKGHEVILYRKPSTDGKPAVWSRVVEGDENVEKVPAEFKHRDEINIVLNNTSGFYALLKYRPMDSIWLKLFMWVR